MPIHQKKRAFEKARPAANTKLGTKRDVRSVRCRGGNLKYRALSLDYGNFTWVSEQTTRKAKITDVVYNATNNELVRTKTIVKNCIVQIDATPFKNWIHTHFRGGPAQDIKKVDFAFENQTERAKLKKEGKLKTSARKYLKRRIHHHIEAHIQSQINKGVLLACISSRPGQVGRADGYILEGKELDFYLKKMEKK